MNFWKLLAAGVLASALVLPGTADAKRKKSDDSAEQATETVDIEDCGVAEFDTVFNEARGIHDTLTDAQTKLAEANTGIATALGLDPGATLADALTNLKELGGDAISMTLDGTTPKLSATDAAPAEVTAAIEAVNTAVGNVLEVAASLATLPDQSKQVVESAKALPGQLNADILESNGLAAKDLLGVGKTVKNNVKAIGTTPDRVTSVTGELTAFVDTVKTTFGG